MSMRVKLSGSQSLLTSAAYEVSGGGAREHYNALPKRRQHSKPPVAADVRRL
jgi:hypothetical protein